MDFSEFGIRIGAALIAGLCIGFERELRNKDAGLKTNALVAVGAAVYVYASLQFMDFPNVDVTRVMGQVVTGIGFIGAGVILHKGGSVSGLTTAATVWCSAAAGCLAAAGFYQELLMLTILIVFVNVVFGALDNFLERKVRSKFKSDKDR